MTLQGIITTPVTLSNRLAAAGLEQSLRLYLLRHPAPRRKDMAWKSHWEVVDQLFELILPLGNLVIDAIHIRTQRVKPRPGAIGIQEVAFECYGADAVVAAAA